MTANSNSLVGAIILAAGGSMRMGEGKQLLPLGGNTVLGQTIANVRAAGVDDIVLVLGSSAETIRHQLPASAIECLKVVVNHAYSEGMASSLREGLSALDARIEGVLIVLADQPFIHPATLDRIVDCYRHSNAQIAIPVYKGVRGNPVLLGRSVFPEIMALHGDIGCRAIFASHLEEIVRVEVEDVGILLDIDDRDDYERLRGFDQSTPEERLLIEAEIISRRSDCPLERSRK